MTILRIPYSITLIAALCLIAALTQNGYADRLSSVERLTDPLIQSTPMALQTMIAQPQLAQSDIIRPIQSEFENEEDVKADRVSVAKVVGLSFLLPGAGQWTMGAKKRAGAFLGTEAIAWTAFAFFKSAQHTKEDDFQLQALRHAGAQPEGKDESFYRALTFYESRERYNEEGRLLGGSRQYYPDDPEWDWQWDSEESMDRYRTLRNQSNEAESRARFTLGAALANRLVAAVDAWRTARAINRKARMETAQWKVRLKGRPSLSNPGASLILSLKF